MQMKSGSFLGAMTVCVAVFVGCGATRDDVGDNVAPLDVVVAEEDTCTVTPEELADDAEAPPAADAATGSPEPGSTSIQSAALGRDGGRPPRDVAAYQACLGKCYERLLTKCKKTATQIGVALFCSNLCCTLHPLSCPRFGDP
jgi:hypothetical protein